MQIFSHVLLELSGCKSKILGSFAVFTAIVLVKVQHIYLQEHREDRIP